MEKRMRYTWKDAAAVAGAGILFAAGLVLLAADFDARALPLAAFIWTKIGGVCCWLLAGAIFRPYNRERRGR
ncbi:MAG: hypothetical protein LUD50_01225 [Clostridia bacterium]|nr:hypothetical protein [Clostridia bacterium]